MHIALGTTEWTIEGDPEQCSAQLDALIDQGVIHPSDKPEIAAIIAALVEDEAVPGEITMRVTDPNQLN